jgi:sulfatase modifying factor 1
MDKSTLDKLVPAERERLLQLQLDIEGELLGSVLKKLMERFDLSINQVAVSVGIDVARLNQVLNGAYREFKAGSDDALLDELVAQGKLNENAPADQLEKVIWRRALRIAMFLRPDLYHVVESHIPTLGDRATRAITLGKYLRNEYPALAETYAPTEDQTLFAPLASVVARELVRRWGAESEPTNHVTHPEHRTEHPDATANEATPQEALLPETDALFLMTFLAPRTAEDLPALAGTEWRQVLGEEPLMVTRRLEEAALIVRAKDSQLQCSEKGIALIKQYLHQVAADMDAAARPGSRIPADRFREVIKWTLITAGAGIIGNRADAALMDLLDRVSKIIDGVTTSPTPGLTPAPPSSPTETPTTANPPRRENAQPEPRKVESPSPPRIQVGKDNKRMIRIPAGWFWMGSREGEGDEDERPQHQVYLDAFYIAETPVTNAEYKKFVDATGHRVPFEDWDSAKPYNWDRLRRTFPAGKENHPVVLVSWDDANTYARWAGKRLPTEAEWEKAARGTDRLTYPWGNTFDQSRCNTWESGIQGTTPVGQFRNGASPYGVLDMVGNVWEWCADWYDSNYYKHSPNHNPRGPNTGYSRSLRGGSWSYHQVYARCAARFGGSPGYRLNLLGFRVAES